jgi:hypothetical protein
LSIVVLLAEDLEQVPNVTLDVEDGRHQDRDIPLFQLVGVPPV